MIRVAALEDVAEKKNEMRDLHGVTPHFSRGPIVLLAFVLAEIASGYAGAG